jgi:hypothetical protein
METAKKMKRLKDEEAKQKQLPGITAEKKPLPSETAKTPKLPSAIVSGILKDVTKEKSNMSEKDVNAVTEIDGEIVKWKAGKNPAYEERMMRLQKKKK